MCTPGHFFAPHNPEGFVGKSLDAVMSCAGQGMRNEFANVGRAGKNSRSKPEVFDRLFQTSRTIRRLVRIQQGNG
jgi:hypothetical protein